MVISLLQPCLIPDLDYLARIFKSDRVFIADTDRFSRKGRINRWQIRVPEGSQWMNIPIMTADRSKSIREVRIDHARLKPAKLMYSLELNYRNSIYFDHYQPEIAADFEAATGYEFLCDYISYINGRLFEFLDISFEADYLSHSAFENLHPDAISEAMGASAVYQERASVNFQIQATRKQEPDFTHPAYRQHFEGFVPHCCLLDILFAYGPTSFQILDKL